jgi:uncharacterized membrane protein YedE/YeeE
MKRAIPFVAGLVFALGLGLSGMTDPNKVLGFLDVFGRWDASLVLVMAGAIGVHLPFLRFVRRPEVASDCGIPAPRGPRADPALLLGAALFGIGWGLAGYCPGPALVAAATGGAHVVVLVLTMLLGAALHGLAEPHLAPHPRAERTTSLT